MLLRSTDRLTGGRKLYWEICIVLGACVFAMPVGAPAGAEQVIRTADVPDDTDRRTDALGWTTSQYVPLPSIRLTEHDDAGLDADHELPIEIDEHGHPAYVHEVGPLIDPQARVSRVGQLPRMAVTALDGDPTNLNAMLVPGTIVHFWASWCGPCTEEFPELERFYRLHLADGREARGLRLITISNDVAIGSAARFLEKHAITFPVFLDIRQASNLALVGQRTLPATVLVGADGRLHRLALGKLDWAHKGLPDILVATAVASPRPVLEQLDQAVE